MARSRGLLVIRAALAVAGGAMLTAGSPAVAAGPASQYVPGAWEGPWSVSYPTISGLSATLTWTPVADADARNRMMSSSLWGPLGSLCSSAAAETEFYSGDIRQTYNGQQVSPVAAAGCTTGTDLVGRFDNGSFRMARAGSDHTTWTGTFVDERNGNSYPWSGRFAGPPRTPAPLTTRDEVAPPPPPPEPPPASTPPAPGTPPPAPPGESMTLQDYLNCGGDFGIGTGGAMKPAARRSQDTDQTTPDPNCPYPVTPRDELPSNGRVTSYLSPRNGGTAALPVVHVGPRARTARVDVVTARANGLALDDEDFVVAVGAEASGAAVRLCAILVIADNGTIADAFNPSVFPTYSRCVTVVGKILQRADDLRRRRAAATATTAALAPCRSRTARLTRVRRRAPVTVTCVRTRIGRRITIRRSGGGRLRPVLGPGSSLIIGRARSGAAAQPGDRVNVQWKTSSR